MKKVMLVIVAFCLVFTMFFKNALADSVRGYYRSNGTYVSSSYRSHPNHTVTDNYSFKGNTNPYNGQEGHNYYKHNPTSPYYDRTTQYNFKKIQY